MSTSHRWLTLAAAGAAGLGYYLFSKRQIATAAANAVVAASSRLSPKSVPLPDSEPAQVSNQLLVINRRNDLMLRQRFEKLIPTNQNAPHAFTLQFCTRDTLPVDASFDLKLFFTHLATKQLGAVTMFSERVSSTQSILADHFSSVNDRLVFVAAQQSSGRGRGGNSWTSPRGCLMFSFKTQSQNGAQLAFLQYLISLAVCDAVGELPCLSHARAQQLRSHVRIKWPNDIYTDDGKKIGGVLCQSTYMNGTFNLLIGIGLNVSNDAPTTCLDSLLHMVSSQCSTEPVGTSSIPMEMLLATLCNVLERHLDTFEERGFEPFKQSYLESWLHSGQQLRLRDDEGLERLVKVSGLTSTGYLSAEAVDNGDKFELHPDGNSLDFFAGLIAKKRSA